MVLHVYAHEGTKVPARHEGQFTDEAPLGLHLREERRGRASGGGGEVEITH